MAANPTAAPFSSSAADPSTQTSGGDGILNIFAFNHLLLEALYKEGSSETISSFRLRFDI